MNNTISILGCGWLGLPLAQSLRNLGCTVKGSTTTSKKISILKEYGILPYLLHCDPPLVGENVEDFFNSQVGILTIPFKRNLADPRIYFEQIKAIVSYIERSCIKFVIFCSSTSVYPDHWPWAKEDSRFFPDDSRAETLLALEEYLMMDQCFASTIIRLGGLYGGTRQVGKFLAGKENVLYPQSPVNLIHFEDAIGIIVEVIRQDSKGEIFNACSDEHPTRRELYTHSARKMNLTVPTFVEDSVGPCKKVSNDKVKERLGYRFKYPNPLMPHE